MIGETLICQTEFGNIHDLYAVPVSTTNGVTVGHMPQPFATFSSGIQVPYFAQVTGRRRYSADIFGTRWT